MRIKSLLLAFLLLGVSSLFAAPFQNVKKILTQPDGTQLHCFASGDEFYNRLHDADGYTIVQAQNGYFVYATSDARGNIIATQHIAGKTNPKALGLEPNIVISQSEYQKRRDAMKVPETRLSNDLNHGVYNNLVIFIKFKGDNDFTTTKTEIDSMFNYNGYYDISMNNYFKKATYNQLSMVSYCYPLPEDDKVIAYEDIYPRNYYQPYNETTNPEGYTNQAEREFPLLKRAIEHIADFVPDTLNIDRDNDGYIDNVIFVVKGNVGDWSDLLWPHMWSMYGEDAYINGKKVGTFNFQLETSSYFTVSTLCHEMSHSLGFPDLYHYNYGTSLSPSGPWDLMCGNTNPPQHSSTYMKYKYGTWIDEIPEIGYGTYTIEANSWEGGRRNCYKIPSSHPKQFYLLEYRNKSNFFERGLPNSGLLIYRIDTRYHGCADYNGSNTFDEVYIFRPGGRPTQDGRIHSAAFSQEEGMTTFNYDTDPYPFLNKNQEDLTLNICNISTRGDQMTFTYCPVDVENVPQNLAVNVNANEKIVELKWDINELAESYNIYRDDSIIANVTENHFNDIITNDLSGYHKYHITSLSGDDESYRSNEKEIVLGNFTEYIINMTTTGGNGWQGGEITVSFDNAMKDRYFTIYSGYEKESSIVVPEGVEVTFSWTPGWDDTECSFTISNNGEIVYTSSQLQEGVFAQFITSGGNVCITPENLSAEVDGNNVILAWNSIVESQNYAILRNDEIIAENIKTNYFIDKDIPASGTYQYCVKSMNGEDMSRPSNVETISVMRVNYEKLALESKVENEKVTLNWRAPKAYESTMRYDNGNYTTSEGSSSHNWGIRIPSEKLKLFNNIDISSIEIFDACNTKYTFKIYNGENVHDSTLLYSELFETNKTNSFVRFELTEKVLFDNEKDLWIIAKASGGNKPIPCGDFTGDPNSNLIKAGASWTSASEYNLNYSWLLRAYTSSAEIINENVTYNVYRNDEIIASELTSPEYVDNNINGEVCYKVEAVIDGSVISVSDKICHSIETIPQDPISPKITSSHINIKAKDIINIKIVSVTGAVVYNNNTNNQEVTIDVRNLRSGVYVVQVTTKTETFTEKVVVVF